MQNNDNQHFTGDIALAAYLAYRGFPVEGFVEDDRRPGKLIFAFGQHSSTDPNGLAEITSASGAADLFYRGEAKVDPRRFYNEVNDMRARLYEEKDRAGR